MKKLRFNPYILLLVFVVASLVYWVQFDRSVFPSKNQPVRHEIAIK